MNIKLSKLFIIDPAPFIVVTVVSTQDSSVKVKNGLRLGRVLSKSCTQKIQHLEHILRKDEGCLTLTKLRLGNVGELTSLCNFC